MKSFRLWLLLLLAVLLPLRGALAAGMLCPVAGFGMQAETGLNHAAHSHTHDSGGTQHVQHEAAEQDQGTGHEHVGAGSHDHAGNADNCNLCSAFCSVTGLVGAAVAIPETRPVPAVFLHLYALPSSFVPDGQERPPRTI